MNKYVEGYIVGEDGNVITQGIFKIKQHKKDNGEIVTMCDMPNSLFAYPISMLKYDLTVGQKHDYAEKIKEMEIARIQYEYAEEICRGTNLFGNWKDDLINSYQEMSDDAIILKNIQELRTEFQENEKGIFDYVDWNFKTGAVESIEDFKEKLVDWNNEIGNELNDTYLNSVCIEYPSFLIWNLPHYWKDEHFAALIHSDNGKNLTVLELLWKLNNWLAANRNLQHHVYFEGVERNGEIRLGS